MKLKATHLEKLATIVRGGSPRPAGDPRFFNGDYLPWITVAEVTKDVGIHLTFTNSFLTEEGSQHTRILDPDTLILTNSGATLGVPKITKITAGANDGIAAFLNIEGCTKEYLYYFLQSKTSYFRNSLAPGVGQPNLNTDLIGGVKIILPPIGDQIKIADILLTWDRAIEKQQSLIDNKTERKRGLMQQLVSGSKLLKGGDGKWTEKRLGNLIRFESRKKPKPATPFLAAGVRCHCRGVFLKPEFEPGSIALSELFELQAGDLVVNITFAWEGAVAIVPNEADGALVSHRFPTYVFKKGVASRRFIKHLIQTKRFRFDCGLASPGGAGRNRVLNKKDFLKIKVWCPGYDEQRAIADVLDTCDREINLHRQQLEAIREQKRGLMQKLLTGEVRV